MVEQVAQPAFLRPFRGTDVALDAKHAKPQVLLHALVQESCHKQQKGGQADLLELRYKTRDYICQKKALHTPHFVILTLFSSQAAPKKGIDTLRFAYRLEHLLKYLLFFTDFGSQLLHVICCDAHKFGYLGIAPVRKFLDNLYG